jgi:hypothetical protein
MVPTVSVLMMTHIVEVFVWALAYPIFGVAPGDAHRVYFAFVNFATLGYGDIVPVELWRRSGRSCDERRVVVWMSTAVMFELLRRTLARYESSTGD